MTSKLHHLWTGKQACLVAIAILLLAGFCFGQPAVSLSPKDGPPTTTLRVSGSGFTPYAQIDIYFDNQDQALAVADATGAFRRIAIKAPRSAVPGTHWVSAVERSGHHAKQEIFEVHVNWTEFHTKDMRRYNPYENVLNVNNVGTLQMRGSRKIGFTLSAAPSSPAVVKDVLYIGSPPDDYSVYAFNVRTGHQLWKYTTRDYVTSSPAVANEVVYVGSWDGNVYALDASTGAMLGRYQTGNFVLSSPTVANGVVYFDSTDYNVYALDARTGVLLWSYATGSWVDSSPAVANGVVYVGSGDGNVYALDASTGTKLWSYHTGGSVVSSPAVANGVVYVGSSDFNVYALDASTGAKLWSYQTGWFVDSSPAVANGVVYVGSDDGNVYAFGLPKGLAKQAPKRPDPKALRPDFNLKASRPSTAGTD